MKPMSRIWKEPYTEEKAREINVHGIEDVVLLGGPDAKWIYYVYVRSFTFAFYSLAMIQEYLDYYNTKILPSRMGGSIWVGEPQTKLNRLPLRLRNEAKRHQVIKALTKALYEFRKQEGVLLNTSA